MALGSHPSSWIANNGSESPDDQLEEDATDWASLILHDVLILFLGVGVDGSPAPAPRIIMFDETSTFDHIKEELANEHIDVSHWTLLQTHYGPVPYWSEADPNSLVGTDCHTVYAINSNEKGYVLGVLRSSDADSPLLILDPGTPQTILQTVSVDLGLANVKSIALYSDPLSDAKTIQWNYDKPLKSEGSTFPTAFVITLGEPPDPFQLDMPLELFPPFLQIPFMDASSLRRRSYEFQSFALQTIHLSRCLLHAIISLAQVTKTPYTKHDGPVSSVDKWTPVNASLLVDNLEQYLADLESCESSMANADFDRDDIQGTFDRVFLALCSDHPGAVAIRHSHKVFEQLKMRDHQRLDSQGLDDADRGTESGYTSEHSIHRGRRGDQDTKKNVSGNEDTSDEEALEQQLPESDTTVHCILERFVMSLLSCLKGEAFRDLDT